MTRVLITGASGFIGGHLCEALARRGDAIRCLVRPTSRSEHLQQLGVQLVHGALDHRESLREAVAGVDVVYHLAGKTCALHRAELNRVNGRGVARLAGCCAAQEKPPTLVLVSSVAAAGPTRRGQLRVESDEPAPISIYGHSKRLGELAATARVKHVPTTIVRPGMVFGARDRECLAMFRAIHRLRMHPIAGFSSPPLSLIHVADLVEILIRAAEQGTRVCADGDKEACRGRGYYFACAPEYPDYAELGRMIRTVLDRPYAPMIYTGPAAWVLAGANQLLGRMRRRPDNFNLDKIREATCDSWACSTAAVQRDLRFTPPKSIAQRLRETAVWYREQGWL